MRKRVVNAVISRLPGYIYLKVDFNSGLCKAS